MTITTASAVGAEITSAEPVLTVPTNLHAITNTQKTLADVKFEKPTAGKTTAVAEVDADGKATVKVPEKSITDAITNASKPPRKMAQRTAEYPLK